jgi:hypothetical protein
VSVQTLRNQLKRAVAGIGDVPRVVVVAPDGTTREISGTTNAFGRMLELWEGRVKAADSPLLARSAADLEALRNSVELRPAANNRDGSGLQMLALLDAIVKGPAE